jgi:CO dehydrogenase maturation factor
VIAVTGKGGTGKTMISALLIHFFARDRSVLAVDADPDSNLPEALGIDGFRTLGEIREIFQESRDEIRDKEQWLEGKIYEIIYEHDDFDLLVMGRSEGEGCYCYVNNLLKGVLQRLLKNYDVIIIDSEAGLEHFSRKTIDCADYIIVVTDMSKKGLATAKRIKELSKELNLNFERIYIVGNKISNKEAAELIKRFAEEEGIELLEIFPYDERIAELDLKGEPIVKILEHAEYNKKVEKVAGGVEK